MYGVWYSMYVMYVCDIVLHVWCMVYVSSMYVRPNLLCPCVCVLILMYSVKVGGATMLSLDVY